VAGSGLSSGYWSGVGRLLNDRRWLVFLIAVFVGGIGASLTNNFLFLYMSELHADQTMMGLALTMATVSETPALFFSGWLVRKLGPRRMLLMALSAYALRLLLYSIAAAPWQVLLIQLMHGLTFSAMWTAGVSYAGQMAPKGMEATAQGLFNAVLMGFGGITGAMIGGLLIDRFGGAGMYRIGSCVILAGLGIFLLASHQVERQQS
jgi:PPP family 3-phenylpropionic acid transporter